MLVCAYIQLPLGHRSVNTMRQQQETAVFLAGVLAVVRGQSFPLFGSVTNNFFLGACPDVEVAQKFSLELVGGA